MDSLLYDNGLRHERVKRIFLSAIAVPFFNTINFAELQVLPATEFFSNAFAS